MASMSFGTVVPAGCTPGQVELSRTAKGVFVLNMLASGSNPENRWTLAFTRAIHIAFDAVDAAIRADGPGTPASLLTVSSSPKFFSNGIDPAWVMSPDTSHQDKLDWNDLVMPAFARPILLPCPTVCAIAGHAFGAGLMFALGHDHRMQQLEKGYLCAIEVAIGFPTPPPEFTLFRHCMPADAFYSTVLEAKRWGAEEAMRRGLISRAVPRDMLVSEAIKEATRQAKLTAKGAVGWTKWHTKGFVAKEILEYTFKKGKGGKAELPPGLQALVTTIVVQGKEPEWVKPLMAVL